MIELLEADILSEQRSQSLSREDAVASLTAKLKRVSDIIAETSPDAAAEISKAVAISNEAKRNAGDLLEKRREFIYDLMGRITHLGRLRAEIVELNALALSDDGEKVLAEATLESFLANLRSVSPANSGLYRRNLESLAFFKSLTTHVGPFVAKRKKIADELASEIRSTASAEKISLSNLLKVMRDEARPGGKQGLLNDLAAGHLDDLK